MKKLISTLCSLTVFSTTAANLISCGVNNTASLEEIYEMEEVKTNLVIEKLKHGIDGSHLSTNNTVGEAFDEIQRTILTYFPEVSEIIFLENQNQNFLKPIDNYFNVGIKNSQGNVTNVKALIKNVQLVKINTDEEKEASKDEVISTNLIKQKFEYGLNGSNLTGWNTIFDALEIYQNQAKKINKNANIVFTTNYMNSNLEKSALKNFYDESVSVSIINTSKVDTGKFKLAWKHVLNWIGATISKNIYKQQTPNCSVDLETVCHADLGAKYALSKSAREIWESIESEYFTKAQTFYSEISWLKVKETYQYMKNNFSKFKQWLSEKYSNFTRVKSSFLKGKTQNLELLLTFGDPLSSNYTSQNITTIKAKLLDVQERSAIAAKKELKIKFSAFLVMQIIIQLTELQLK